MCGRTHTTRTNITPPRSPTIVPSLQHHSKFLFIPKHHLRLPARRCLLHYHSNRVDRPTSRLVFAPMQVIFTFPVPPLTIRRLDWRHHLRPSFTMFVHIMLLMVNKSMHCPDSDCIVIPPHNYSSIFYMGCFLGSDSLVSAMLSITLNDLISTIVSLSLADTLLFFLGRRMFYPRYACGSTYT